MSLEHLDITLDDRGWPEVQIVLKHGQKVHVDKARFDQAAERFSSAVSKFVNDTLQIQISRRKQNGS